MGKMTCEELEQKVKTLENEISELRKVKDELNETNKIFNLFMEHNPVYTFFKDKDIRSIRLSKNYEKMLGMPIDEILGKTMDELFPSDLAKSMIADDISVIENGKPIKVEEEFNGRFYETIKFPIIIADKPKYLAGYTLDITERKKDEETKKELQKQLVNAMEIANMAPWEFDLKEKIYKFNDSFYRILGTTAQKMGGYNISFDDFSKRFIYPDDISLIYKISSEAVRAEDPDAIWQIGHRILYADGRAGYVNVRFFIIRDDSGEAVKVRGVMQDITEHTLIEKKMKENEEKLNRSMKMESLGLLAGGVAHDLNNVLAGIVSYPDLLIMEAPDNVKIKKFARAIRESGNRAVAIVQDLLTIARGVASVKEPLNLNKIIRDYIRSPEHEKLKQYHTLVRTVTDLDMDLFNIKGSHVHLRKIIMNLVSNASEAIDGGGRITISTRNKYLDKPLSGYENVKPGEYVVLTVSDTGSGIAPDNLERIFEPFFTKKTIGRSGTGLGLTVVWNTVQDHDGYIDVSSNETGTRFAVYLPTTREELPGEKSDISLENLKGEGETILIVDDLKSQRVVLENILENLDYRTASVSGGEGAVEFLKDNNADLILLNMIMDPGINGRETYERIIQIKPGQKALLMSGFIETEEVKEAQRLGAGQYIKKPLSFEKLGLAIKEELGK